MKIPILYRCECGEIVPEDPKNRHFEVCGKTMFKLDVLEIRDHLIQLLEIENEELREMNAVNLGRLINYKMQVAQHERNITKLETTMGKIEKELQLLAELTTDKPKEPEESGYDINHSQEAKVKMALGVVAELKLKEAGCITLVCPKCGSERKNDIRTAQCLDTACRGIMAKKEI